MQTHAIRYLKNFHREIKMLENYPNMKRIFFKYNAILPLSALSCGEILSICCNDKYGYLLAEMFEARTILLQQAWLRYKNSRTLNLNILLWSNRSLSVRINNEQSDHNLLCQIICYFIWMILSTRTRNYLEIIYLNSWKIKLLSLCCF